MMPPESFCSEIAEQFLLAQTCIGYLGSFEVPYEFLDCFISVKNTIGILKGTTQNSMRINIQKQKNKLIQ
jgi:hypothetical protein